MENARGRFIIWKTPGVDLSHGKRPGTIYHIENARGDYTYLLSYCIHCSFNQYMVQTFDMDASLCDISNVLEAFHCIKATCNASKSSASTSLTA